MERDHTAHLIPPSPSSTWLQMDQRGSGAGEGMVQNSLHKSVQLRWLLWLQETQEIQVLVKESQYCSLGQFAIAAPGCLSCGRRDGTLGERAYGQAEPRWPLLPHSEMFSVSTGRGQTQLASTLSCDLGWVLPPTPFPICKIVSPRVPH